ncbi:MAG: ABA4-like family protein [Pseudomonadota bacterium]
MLAPETIFTLGNQLALVGWIILVFFPRRFIPVVWIPHFIIPGVLGLAYAMLILTSFGQSDGSFSSIEGVRTLFADDLALTAGWLHYLAFDLFIGSWIALEADKIGVPRILQAPILLATFMLGPIGLVIFLVIKACAGWSPTIANPAQGAQPVSQAPGSQAPSSQADNRI